MQIPRLDSLKPYPQMEMRYLEAAYWVGELREHESRDWLDTQNSCSTKLT